MNREPTSKSHEFNLSYPLWMILSCVRQLGSDYNPFRANQINIAGKRIGVFGGWKTYDNHLNKIGLMG
jgi:hypothetical protein